MLTLAISLSIGVLLAALVGFTGRLAASLVEIHIYGGPVPGLGQDCRERQWIILDAAKRWASQNQGVLPGRGEWQSAVREAGYNSWPGCQGSKNEFKVYDWLLESSIALNSTERPEQLPVLRCTNHGRSVITTYADGHQESHRTPEYERWRCLWAF